MISHRSNAGAPPVAAPPVTPDAQRVGSADDASDSNASSPPTFYKKTIASLACVAAASLLSVVCIASLSPRHPDKKLSSALGSPLGTAAHHQLAFLPVSETLPSNHTTTAQQSEQKLTQPTEPPVEKTRLTQHSLTKVAHQHFQAALPTGSEASRTSTSEHDPPYHLEDLVALEAAAMKIPLCAPPKKYNAEFAEEDAAEDSFQQISEKLGKDKNKNKNKNNSNPEPSPTQFLMENANTLVSATAFDNSFCKWQPLDWMTSVTNADKAVPSGHQPDQIVRVPDLLTFPEKPGALGNEQCDSTLPHYGTQVRWIDQPENAFQLANNEDKLVFMLHISGNFKIPGFT
ncbi:hypothetical protein OAE54_00145 [bacterium]|nr:hypothetical protein [bacterium]